MSSNLHKLRLGPLPRNESIKLTVSLPAELKTCLDDYAAAHSRPAWRRGERCNFDSSHAAIVHCP